MYKKVSDVASIIQDGDTIFIKKAIYENDKQVTITKNNILIIGETGRPILKAGSIIASDQSNGKGIFVIRGNNVTIDNIEFQNAKVVDRNGAGIRQEGCNLKVLRCKFLNNENGILCGTIPNCKTTVEYCDFEQNGSSLNPGYQHNIYINNIDTLIFRFNTSINAAAEGHELKSRAKFNYIAYNNIANYTTDDSRTIDLPNGGISIIIGNVIEQGPNSANNNILGYGLEGFSNPAPHGLYIVNNTFVNRRGNGSHVQIPNVTFDKFLIQNNVFVGGGAIVNGNQDEYRANVLIPKLTDAQPYFEDMNLYNYALVKGSTMIDIGIPISYNVGNYSLTPYLEFHGVDNIIERHKDGKIDVGAYEYVGTSSALDLDNYLFYPNPVRDILYLPDMVVDGHIKFYSQYGHLTVLFCQDEQVDVSKLTPGLYTILLQNKVFQLIKM